MPPTWLTLIAWIWLGISFVSSGVILFDIFVRGHRQPMGVMDAVYPITALYLGPLAWSAYRRWGRLSSPRYQLVARAAPDYGQSVSVGIAVSHCGAGC